MNLLVELRPALEGHAGIPQENRLLYRGLCASEGLSTQGLLQSPSLFLPEGAPLPGQRALPPQDQVDRMARIVVALSDTTVPNGLQRWVRRARKFAALGGFVLATLAGSKVRMSGFDAGQFRDFVWRRLFAKSLPPQDLDIVTRAPLRMLRAPYTAMHALGVFTSRLGFALYPRLDTSGFDVLLAQTPFPGRVSGATRLVVRYMDAVPLLLPHTIIRRSFHQALHFHALKANVAAGAYFVCASEATRADLVKVFPEVAPRAVTIHCMLSHHYHPTTDGAVDLRDVLKRRRRAEGPGAPLRTTLDDTAGGLRYLLMVSTLEPRKNHETLVAAWEQLRLRHPELKLVLVGGLGWDFEPLLDRLRGWVEQGEVIHLHDVPADEVRLLYQRAALTVCPSVAEGFDYSGVEAMRCGSVVAASDIAVHREVYGDAAVYFNPYDAQAMAAAVGRILEGDPSGLRAELLARGTVVSSRYLPERILPQWRSFLASLSGELTLAQEEGV